VHFTARATALLATLVIALAASIYVASELQRSSAERSAEKAAAVESLLIAQLDLETGLRGFLQFADERFLEPYRAGRREFTEALVDAREAADGDSEITASVDRQAALSTRWQGLAQEAIVKRRADRIPSLKAALERRSIVEDFRAENGQLREIVEDRRASSAERTSLLLLLLVLVPSALVGIAAYLAVIRPARERGARELEARRYRRAGDEFTHTLQAIDDESGAQRLLKRHIERDIADCEVVVLNRNNSSNRLEAVGDAVLDPDLAEKLDDATPRSCLAVRLGREHDEWVDDDPLVSCELCGQSGAALCVPAIVSGEVIGSVLVRSEEPLAELERDRAVSTIAQTAPVIANLRSLAIAETRAATDSLTGLANKRACDEMLRRMVAHSGRRLSQMAVLAIDLDHFKRINDRFGHGVGDDVLAAVGAVLSENVRGSDFAGRPGGEEFLVYLADTAVDGACQVAEKLRRTISELRVAGCEVPITASIGVAVHPDHAGDAESLLRIADRALYAAKAAGRNRVEVAGPTGSATSDAEAPPS
jgi:diguanylate cyclase (GGDEF)-like protein